MDLKIKTRKKKIISYLKEYFSGSKVDCGDNKISKFSKRCDKKKKKQETEYRTGRHKRVITFTIYNTQS